MNSSSIALARKSTEPYWFRMMKYLILSMLLVLGAFWVGSSLVSDVSAQAVTVGDDTWAKPEISGSGPRGGAKEAANHITTQNTGITVNTDIKLTIASWVRLLLTLGAVLAVVAVVVAGAYYIVSFGDDSRRETAKRILLYVVAGTFLILGSYAIVNTLIKAQF